MACKPSSKMVQGRGRLVKNYVVGQEILILKRGCIMEQVNFLKGLQGLFGENRKFQCNKLKHTSKDSIYTKVH